MLVGRAAEYEQVMRAVERRSTLVVCGQPGIGKTALIERLLEECPDALVGRALPALSERAYHPLIQATSVRLVGLEPGPAIRLLRHELESSDVLVLEDLQWADADTLEVLVGLHTHAAVIATLQLGTDSAERVLRVIESVGARVLELGPLDEQSLIELVAALRPDLLAAEHAQLARAAGGIPLVAAATAMSVDQPGGGSVEGALAIEALLARQTPADRVSLAIIDAAGGSAALEDLGPVDGLVGSGLVRKVSDGRVELVHPFFAAPDVLRLDGAQLREVWTRVAALEGTPPTRRAECRLNCGEYASALADALHAADGPLTRAEQSVALRVAARAAIELRAASSPTGLSDADHAELLVRAAAAANDVFAFDVALELLEDLGDFTGGSATDAALESLRAVVASGDRARGIDLVERTAPVLERASGARAARARALRAMVDGWSGGVGPVGLQALVSTQLDVARSGAERSDAALLRGVAAYGRSAQDAVEWFEVARLEARRDDAMSSEFEASRNLIMVRIALGQHDAARELCAQCDRRAVEAGEIGWSVEFRTLDVLSRFYDDADQGDAIAWLSSVRTAPVRLETRAFATASLATILGDLGAVERSAKVLEEWTRQEVLDGLEPFVQCVVSWGAAQRAWIVGDLHEAIRIGQWVAERVAAGYPSVAGIQVVWRWAEYEAGLPITAPDPVGGLLDCAQLEADAIALLAGGDPGAAAERFLAAAESWRPILWRCALRARWGAGHALVGAGCNERAIEVLSAVDAELDRSGCPALRPRVEAGLRAAGAQRARRVSPSRAVQSITVRECDVLKLVAEGHSSASAARRLGIGVATVNGHVRSAMRKLGARSRVEAAAIVGLAG